MKTTYSRCGGYYWKEGYGWVKRIDWPRFWDIFFLVIRYIALILIAIAIYNTQVAINNLKDALK